jgi:diguanylate cyclase (GGDEF)-like protein/PAS domain S-box-containing protein
MQALDIDGLIDQLADAVVVIDTTGVLRGANSTTVEQFGWRQEEWLGRSILELLHPDDLDWALSSLGTVTAKTVGTPIEVRVRTADDWRLVEVIGRAIEKDGQELILLSIRDLTERRRWEVAGDDMAMFRSILQNAASLTFLLDESGQVRAASAALIRMTGFGPDEVIGRELRTLAVDEDRSRLRKAITTLVDQDGRTTRLEASFSTKEGTTAPCQLTIVNLLEDPTVQGLVVSAHDISELRRARHELEYLAEHDSLTGLPNRSQLTRFLQTRLDGTEEDRSPILVAFIDLDRFKPVNDLYGHESGDELLASVAARLRDAVRDEDLVARFGGDEFVVVTGSRGDLEPEHLAARIDRALSGPFHLSVGAVRISASIGVVEADHENDVETVLAEADMAMYAIKNSDRVPTRTRTVLTRRRLAERIEKALEVGEFGVHYQPIVELETGRWIGLEALCRWNHPERGLLLPVDFLDIIEDTGNSARLGKIVVNTVCTELTRLRQSTGATPDIAVNASADEMTNPEYPLMIADALRDGGLEPRQLTIEISERSMLGRGGRTGKAIPTNLAALSDAGVRIAVDDFGTGYSSLTHLVAFPLDVIKIDRSFVAGVVGDDQRRSVIAALVGLADNTDMTVIAEGIDQENQIAVLRELGCRLGQGFHYARPMPYENLEMAFRTEGALRDHQTRKREASR